MQAIYTVCTSFEKWTNYLSTSKQTKPNCPFLPATTHIVSWRVQTGAYARTFLELTWPFMQNVASSPITQFGRRCSFLLHRFVKHLAKFSRLCMKIMHVVTNYAVRACSMGVVANPIKSVKNLKHQLGVQRADFSITQYFLQIYRSCVCLPPLRFRLVPRSAQTFAHCTRWH